MKAKNKMSKNKKIIIIAISLIILLVACIILFSYINSKELEMASNINPKSENMKEKKDLLVNVEEVDTKVPKSIDAAVPIFMYHFIRDTPIPGEHMEMNVKPETLRQQLEYLKNNGYETIFMSDLKNLKNYKKPVGLTFDDGWEDFYYNAFPIFKEYNMKASLYVITGAVGQKNYCTLEQLKEMKESGLIDLQSHTKSHPKLAELDSEKIDFELQTSKEYLKDNLGINSDVICYPYGSTSDLVRTKAKEKNYDVGLNMEGGIYYTSTHKNIYAVPRIYANRSMPLDTFANYVKKSYVNVTW